MTTISSARSVSVIVVTLGERSICWTRPSMNVETVTVPGGFVTVNVVPCSGSSSIVEPHIGRTEVRRIRLGVVCVEVEHRQIVVSS